MGTYVEGRSAAVNFDDVVEEGVYRVYSGSSQYGNGK